MPLPSRSVGCVSTSARTTSSRTPMRRCARISRPSPPKAAACGSRTTSSRASSVWCGRTTAAMPGTRSSHLTELFDLPEGAEGEMDIEGLDVDGGWLWVVGSHSLTREKPKPGEHDPAEALARLTEVEHHPNRHFLGRIPVVESAARAARDPPRGGRRGPQRRTPARLPQDEQQGRRARPWRSPTTCTSPASWACRPRRTASTSRVSRRAAIALFLGMRGPVLRGWATAARDRGRGAQARPPQAQEDRSGRRALPQALPRPRRARHPRARLRRRCAPDPRRPDHGPRRPGRGLSLAGRARRRASAP